MESYFKNKSILKVISLWKYHLLVITAAGIILSVIGSSSWIIIPKFKSTAVLYPVNLGTFSEESTTEQMLQILRSNEIKDSIIKVFHLDRHYKISSTDPHFKTYIYGEYDDNVSFSKTEFESVEIRVLDKDPKVACAIVDSIIGFYDRKVANMHRKKYWEVVIISQEAMNKKKREMDTLETMLDSFRLKYGLLDYKIQAMGVSDGISKGNTGSVLNDLYRNLEKFGQQFKDLDSLFKYAQRDYFWQKNNYETALRDYSKKITYCHIVSDPYPADKKSYPVRWLIVLLSAIGSFFIGLIVVAFLESRKKNPNPTNA